MSNVTIIPDSRVSVTDASTLPAVIPQNWARLHGLSEQSDSAIKQLAKGEVEISLESLGSVLAKIARDVDQCHRQEVPVEETPHYKKHRVEIARQSRQRADELTKVISKLADILERIDKQNQRLGQARFEERTVVAKERLAEELERIKDGKKG